jgi:putative thioredoxin
MGAGGMGPDASALAMRGAVDLGALAQAREAQAAAAERARARADDGTAPSEAALVVDVDEATFQADVVERSYQVPVVIDFWAEWCGPCKQLSPILERLAVEYAGRWVLAKIDVDANQRLGQAFGVQSIPSLFAVVAGQPIPLFQGAVPEPQVRQVLDELLAVAAQNGVDGRVEVAEAGDAAEAATDEPVIDDTDPEFDEVATALDAGDLAAARGAYERLLARRPGDPDAIAGLALLGVLDRVRGLDPVHTLEALAAAPDDHTLRLAAADVQMASGQAGAAFATLIEGVRRTSGAERDAVRARLLELFEVAGSDHPDVAPARLALANALF